MSASTEIFRPGDIFATFEIREVLARGESSHTYLARQDGLMRDVALKVFSPRVFTGDDEALEAARQDAATVAALEHPGIAATYVAGVQDGALYLATANVGCDTLAELVGCGMVTPAATAEIVEEVARTLEYAHVKGHVHRDIRPESVVRDRWGTMVVRDFGVARASGRTGHLTRAQILASMRYTAPELILGRRPTAATDVFGLAAVAVFCLTGRPPFADRPTAEYVTYRAEAPAPVLHGPDGSVPADLNAVLSPALHADPAVRPALAEFAAELGRAVRALDPAMRDAPSPLRGDEQSPSGAAQAVGGAMSVGSRDATRVEHRRPLAVEAGPEETGRRRWEHYAIAATVALAAAAAGYGAGLLTRPDEVAPIRVGAASADLGTTWTRGGAGAPGVKLDGVALRGPGGMAATVAWRRSDRPPGDPLGADVLGGPAAPKVIRAGRRAIVRYTAGDAQVLVRPARKGMLVVACAAGADEGRCAALLSAFKGGGALVPVEPAADVTKLLAEAMIAVERASGVAAAALVGKADGRANGAREYADALRQAAGTLEAKQLDPGTSEALKAVRSALLDEAGGLEALSEAIDRRSAPRQEAARRDIRGAERQLRAALGGLRAAGYPIRSDSPKGS